MNKHLAVLSIVFFLAVDTVRAQCDPKIVKLQSNKMRFVSGGVPGEEQTMEMFITIDSTKIILAQSYNGETGTVEGDIVEITSCEWKKFLIDGKSEYRVLFNKDEEGKSIKSNMNMLLESTNGYTTVSLCKEDKCDSKVQFVISKYTITEITKAVNQAGEPKKKSKK